MELTWVCPVCGWVLVSAKLALFCTGLVLDVRHARTAMVPKEA